MRKIMIGVAFAAALALSGGTALATDNLLAGKIVIVKPGPPPLFKIIIKPGPPTIPTPGPTDPVALGGTLKVQDLSDPMNTQTYAMPAVGWKGLGNPAGSKGYKYKGAGTLADPCKVALVKTQIVKAVCKNGASLTTPVVGIVAGTFAAGPDKFCANFGGTEVKNTATILKRKTSPAPGACASPSGAFLDNATLF